MTINVFQPALREEELGAVAGVFESNWIGRGKKAEEFEAAFAQHLGVNPDRLLSTTSCTDSLFLAIDMLGIGKKDAVIMPTVHFVGAANAVVASGAKPIFCDVDPRTLNPTVDHLREAYLSRHRIDRVRAIILLHYGGVPCDMEGILRFAREHGLYIIEDSACSVASRYGDRACGTIGDIGVWSFDAMKLLSTGDGGMMYFSDQHFRQLAKSYAYLGQTDQSGMSSTSQEEWWHVNVRFPGRRMLMNDINAAIGIEQLKKLTGFVARRLEIAHIYTELLRDTELLLPPESSTYFYWIQFKDRWARNRAAHHLRENGIYTTFRYYPLHMVTMFASWNQKLPGAEQAAETTLLLPFHHSLSDTDVFKVAVTLMEVL